MATVLDLFHTIKIDSTTMNPVSSRHYELSVNEYTWHVVSLDASTTLTMDFGGVSTARTIYVHAGNSMTVSAYDGANSALINMNTNGYCLLHMVSMTSLNVTNNDSSNGGIVRVGIIGGS